MSAGVHWGGDVFVPACQPLRKILNGDEDVPAPIGPRREIKTAESAKPAPPF